MIVVRFTLVKALLALAAALAIAGAAVAAFAHTAAAQGGPSVYLVIKGPDTLVAERITRAVRTIQGDVTIRGAGRLTYRAELVDGPAVPFLSFQQFGPGAPPDAMPLVSGTLRVSADSIVMEANTPAGQQRFPKPASGWPLPTIGNDFALHEVLIARAKKASTQPYAGKVIALAGTGVILDASVTFIGHDSAVVTLGGQATRFALDAEGQIVGGAVPAAGLSIVRVDGPEATSISLGKPDYSAPAGAPYVAEEVMVRTRAGHVLTGTLTLPRGVSGPVPGVVTITGSGQEDRDESLGSVLPGYRPFRQVADTLGRRGIAVLRLDDRGVNGSGGDVTRATSADFADDIRAGVSYLRSRREIDPDRVALFGHSEGGMIGPLVASTDSKLAALVIAAGPAYTGRKIIDFQLRNLVNGNAKIPAAKKDSAMQASLDEFEKSARGNAWMQYFLTYDPIPTLKKVRTPTLILQGGTDQQVTPEQAPLVEKALRDGGNKNVTLKVFANRNHLFLEDSVGFPGNYGNLKSGRIGAEVLGPLAEWLVITLKAAPPKP